MKVELEWEWAGADLDGAPQSPEELILSMAAARLVASLERDATVHELRDRIRRVQDDEIASRVAPLVAEAIAQPVQRTDQYGTPQGPPQPFAVFVRETTKALLEAKRYGDRETWLEKFIREEVQRVFTKELQETAAAAKAEVLAAVREKGAEVLAQTIAEMAGAQRA